MVAQLTGVRELQRRLAAVGKAPEQYADDWVIHTIIGAKERLRPHKKTGVTSASVQPGRRTKWTREVEVGGAGIFLEYGTKPHDIVPKRASVLAWAASASGRRLSGSTRTGTKSGDMVFARRVRHPGTKPTPFLMPAALVALDDADWEKVVYKDWNGAA